MPYTDERSTVIICAALVQTREIALSSEVEKVGSVIQRLDEYIKGKCSLDWAFCDTGSMALAKPENMEQEEFYKKAKQVQEWFTPLPFVLIVQLLELVSTLESIPKLDLAQNMR